jgi:hypothetical protein
MQQSFNEDSTNYSAMPALDPYPGYNNTRCDELVPDAFLPFLAP